jgi:molybdenum cofactor cytidylyltransferase
MTSTQSIGIVILAAGASTRMGTPKQLLHFQGRSFLRHTTEIALASVCEPVVIVLGANAEQIRHEVSALPVIVVENQEWRQGMGASIQVGIKTLTDESNNTDAVVLLLCDQPFISVNIINQLVEAFYTTAKPIIACQYAETLGVPALFERQFFLELMQLDAHSGAKQVINKYVDLVYPVSFEMGAVDIDTPQDYEKL